MKLKLLLITLVFFLVCSFSLFAQNPFSIKGSVIDTSLNIKLINTSIMVLNAKDSTLAKFTWSKMDGSFSINNLKAGKFILLVSYHDYADYVEHFSLDAVSPSRDFGDIKLILKSRLLQEVLINGAKAITVKGDTTEYDAAHFKTQANASVEDLLKQLPGIQVDQNGRITAQGKPVNKVLLDGEEFFSDDPTLVTRNIRADMVNKVQLFDKKSDQATLTGVDDGVKNKTINITLREDKKNGYFGKVDGGGATDEYYQGQGMFNAFKAKQKFSAYGTIGNTNRTGLGSQDNNKYGIPASQGDALESFTGVYNGEGLPSSKTGGVHYDAKWNTDKQSINMNYRIGSIGVEGAKNTLIQNNLPGGAITNNMNQTNDNTNFRQKLDGIYQVALNPTSTLKITADGSLSNSQTNIGYNTTGTRNNNVLLNTQNRTITNDADYKSASMSALWTKKYKKAGRTLSLSLSQAFNDVETKGYLYALNSFYNTAGTLDSSRIVDQYKPTSVKNAVFNSKLTYSESFSKAFSLVLDYGLRLNNNSSDNKSFNSSAPGKYNLIDNQYTNNFERNLLNNQAGAIFNYKIGQTVLNFGTQLSAIRDKQTDLNTGKEYNRNYINWNPQFIYQYRSSLLLAYSGTTTQPAIEQVQPIKVNTNPLNILIGNPDLKPSYTNSFVYEHQIVEDGGDKSVYLYTTYSFVNNAIISNAFTDAAGKSTYQSVNLKTKTPSSISIDLEMGKKLDKPDLQTGLNLNIDGGTSFDLSNNVLNKTNYWNYSARLSLSKTAVKKYDFRWSFVPGYTFNKSSLQQANNNGWSLKSDASFNIYLPGKMQIGSTANYLFQEKTQAFNRDFDRLLLNTTLTKKFFKKEDLSLNLTVNDLLNQNTGFNRSTSGSQSAGNIFTQTQYTTIKRYLMLSLVWDFIKMGAAPKK